MLDETLSLRVDTRPTPSPFRYRPPPIETTVNFVPLGHSVDDLLHISQATVCVTFVVP